MPVWGLGRDMMICGDESGALMDLESAMMSEVICCSFCPPTRL